MTPQQIIATDARIVARDRELQRVLSVLNAVNQGRGRVALLAGEAGVGKTRLAREVLTHAQELGMQGLLGRCFEQHSAVGFFPFTEVFAAALAAWPAEVRAEAPLRWPELAHVLRTLGAPLEARPQDTQLQVFRAAADFLHALAETNPLVLVLEDLQWADSTSLALVLYLGRHVEEVRVLILGTYRDAEVGRHHPLELTRRELVRERLVEEVDVHRLARDGTAALLKTRLPAECVSEDLVALVHERAQGNPFFTEELVAALVDQGVLLPGVGGLQMSALAEFKLPRNIRSAIGERVSHLTPEARELLTLASVLGQEFDLDLLIASIGRPEAAVLGEIDAVVEARLLEVRRSGHRDRYGFIHALVQQALYEELPAHHRRRLHLRVGEELEKTVPPPPSATDDLARHFLQAGDTERAAGYAVRAGDDAAARYAHTEAAQQYEIALGLLRERGEVAWAAETQRRLASELHDLNRLPEAAVAYEAAVTAFEKLGDSAGQALAYWGLGRLYDSRYDLAAAVANLDAALRLWPAERDNAELARVLADAARAKTFSGDMAAAVQLADRALAIAERLGDRGLLARSLLGVAIAHDQDKDRPMLPLLGRAEGLARGAGDWRTLCRIYGNRGGKHFYLGELEEGLADHRRAIEAAERSGETHRLAFAHQSLAFDCLDVGSWAEGRAATRAGQALDPVGLVEGTPGRADLAWMEGRHEDALSQLRAFVSQARQHHDVQGVTIGLCRLADFSLQLDRFADAEAPAREAADVACSIWRSEVAGCMATLAEALARLDSRDVEAVLMDAERLIEQSEKAVARPQFLRAKALMLVRRGDLAGAVAAFESSAAVARSQHSWVQLARTLAVLAEAARQLGESTLAQQADAERAAIVERIGPEVAGLAWARNLPKARRRPTGRAHSADLGPLGLLSPREREVAGLVAQGLTDRQIADRLVITEGTAGVHVGHILNKLGFHGRSEVAAWTAQHDLGTAS